MVPSGPGRPAPLRSRTRVSWRVRAWDGNGDASDWSAPSSFDMGLLEPHRTDPLRTGAYSYNLTFTLSTTTP